MSGDSITKRSILDCLRANNSAPFPLSSVRACCIVTDGGFVLTPGDLRLDAQSTTVSELSVLCVALGDLIFWKLEASAPRANDSSSVVTLPCSLCFRRSSEF